MPLLLTPSCNTAHLPRASSAHTGSTPSRLLHLLCPGFPFHPCPTLGTRPGSCPSWVPSRPTAGHMAAYGRGGESDSDLWKSCGDAASDSVCPLQNYLGGELFI